MICKHFKNYLVITRNHQIVKRKLLLDYTDFFIVIYLHSKWDALKAIYPDFRKQFDKVCHNILIQCRLDMIITWINRCSKCMLKEFLAIFPYQVGLQ